ncbi:MAG: VWA domain-containing protein, partial [Pseudomonadales bacterium]|nr:VWA domain-containing protein [Pseudomonadales bacterium]
MVSYKLKVPGLCLGAIITLTTSMLAWGDDTEIFFGAATSSSSTIRPNVLFILDTSSSMTSLDGGSTTRLDRMKEALRSILNDSNNINVGLMRFSNPGGPVLYPVSNIDEVIATEVQGSVSTRIVDSADDAEQLPTGEVTLDNLQLSLATITTGGSSGASTNIERRILRSSDDAEQRQNNSMYLGSSDLELMEDGSNSQRVGLRFDTMAIPVGATIESAVIVFTVDYQQSGSLDVEVTGELVDTGTFTSSNNNVRSRSRTSASVLWSIASGSPAENVEVTSADISTIVQEIVNDSSWASNNAITIIIENDSGSGLREFESYDGDSSEAPLLRVTYNTGPVSAGTDTDQTIGLRFQTVLVPQGATITSATLNFTVARYSSGLTSMTLTGEDVDNSVQFTTTNFNVTSRIDTAAAVAWTNADDWLVNDEVKSSPDVTSIVQEIVDRTGWCGGNALTFLIEGSATNVA